jgi:hypothetical protein
MDFCSGQGVKRSNSSTIARLYNAALGKKTQFYGPDSVQHHTSNSTQRNGKLAACLMSLRDGLALGRLFF